MIRALVLIMVLLAASPVGAQGAKRFVEPLEKERVYILADTLGWVLAFHTLPEAKTATCEITTREQPGAQYRRFWEGRTSFTVYLLGDTADAQVESFTLQFDERPPEERLASAEEQRANVLHLRGSATFPLQTAKRLRLRAHLSTQVKCRRRVPDLRP